MGNTDPADRDSRTDAQLLDAHVGGDRDAFAELFRRYRQPLLRVAVAVSRDADEAGDALQDAMLKAHTRAAAFRHDASVHSWLYRIVVNACLDRRRRHRPHVSLDDPAVQAAARTADPTGQVDTALLVRRALLTLPVEQRCVLMAVDMHGYSVADTARLLGVAEGTVKSRGARGRARLAETLAGAA